tara:strand:- start:329 stop:1099 length:771 start_codon:yes stop_codon:yes gene_type:complete
MNLLDLINNLKPSVLKAGEKIMDVYKRGPQKEIKTDGSPVTDADKDAEEIILAAIKQLAPEVLVVSEENADSHIKSSQKNFFLVDPLDGTKEFLKKDGKGSFTVNIGLIENNVPTMGIIYAPALDQMFFGCKNFGAWKTVNGKSTRISARKTQHGKIIAVTSASHQDSETTNWLEKNNIAVTKSIGSSLKFCLVASGQADVYPRFGPTMEWDTAAGDAILRAAGGTVLKPNFLPFQYGKHCYKNEPFIAWGGSQIK